MQNSNNNSIQAKNAIKLIAQFVLFIVGKSPLVVMEDVDLDEAVEIAHNGIFANRSLVFFTFLNMLFQ